MAKAPKPNTYNNDINKSKCIFSRTLDYTQALIHLPLAYILPLKRVKCSRVRVLPQFNLSSISNQGSFAKSTTESDGPIYKSFPPNILLKYLAFTPQENFKTKFYPPSNTLQATKCTILNYYLACYMFKYFCVLLRDRLYTFVTSSPAHFRSLSQPPQHW